MKRLYRCAGRKVETHCLRVEASSSGSALRISKYSNLQPRVILGRMEESALIDEDGRRPASSARLMVSR